MSANIVLRGREIIARGYGMLERLLIERKRSDGRSESLVREVYDPGDSAAILLYDPRRSRVVLVRQFRAPAYAKDGRESLIEVCAGRLEGQDAESRIVKEAEEETGYAIQNPRRLFAAYMSPGCLAEKISFFVAEYDHGRRTGKGGGCAGENEDIEVLEPTLEDALAMIASGEIADAKTILLLHYAKLAGLMPGSRAA